MWAAVSRSISAVMCLLTFMGSEIIATLPPLSTVSVCHVFASASAKGYAPKMPCDLFVLDVGGRLDKGGKAVSS